MQLYPYQQKISDFLIDESILGKPHKILLVDVGLGKTPITAHTIKVLGLSTALIICPVKIKNTWEDQLVAWGSFKREEIFIAWSRSDVVPTSAKCVIANYELLRSRNTVRGKRTKNKLFQQLYLRRWDVCVLDECQKVRSRTSAISFSLLKRNGYPLIGRAYHKWGLSATLHDVHAHVYPLAKTLAPELLGEYDTWDEFTKRYCVPRLINGRWVMDGNARPKELAERLKKLIYVCKHDDANIGMPKVVEEEITIPDLERMCLSIRSHTSATVYKSVGEAKIAFVADYIRDILTDTDESILVCGHHRDALANIAELLSEFGVSLIRGGISPGEFTRQKELFLSKQNRICVINETAAGEGVDGFQHVTRRVVFLENDWTDIMRKQVIGRVARIGQKRLVIVTSFRARRTYDTYIADKQQRKSKSVEQFHNVLRRKNMSVDNFMSEVLSRLASIESMLGGKAEAKAEKKAEAKPEAEKKAEAKAEKKAEAKAEKKAEKKGGKDESVSQDDVRAAAQKLIDKMLDAGYSEDEAKERCKELNALYGAGKKRIIAEVPEERYGDLLRGYANALGAITKKQAEEDSEDDSSDEDDEV